MENDIPTTLIIRYLSNEASTEEAEKLLNWVAADRCHQKIFEEWMETWNYQFPHDPPFELATGLKTLNNRIDVYESEIKRTAMFPWPKLAVAAVTVLVLSAMIVAVRFKAPESIPLTEFKTQAGTIDTVTLSDGSRVVLNENTLLKYPKEFDANFRQVSIEGEAFFEVTKDPKRPFIVEAGELRTQVLGTSFNIKNRAGMITVAVATGRVQVSRGDTIMLLAPSEKVAYTTEQKAIKKEKTNIASDLSWQYPLNFSDAPLSDVALRLEQHYGIPIVLEKKSMNECLITGRFTDESLDKVLSAICFSTGAQIRRVANEYILYGAQCAD